VPIRGFREVGEGFGDVVGITFSARQGDRAYRWEKGDVRILGIVERI
jgi:hypothetical protein